MSTSMISNMITRVYVNNDQSYPSDESLDYKQVFIDVLGNLMGDMFQDGLISYAEEIESKLKGYRSRLRDEQQYLDNKGS